MTHGLVSPALGGLSMPYSNGNVNRHVEDTASALLRQGALTMRITADLLGDCTQTEKKNFLDSLRNSCKFELSANRAAMAAVENIVADSGRTNSHTFLLGDEQNTCRDCNMRRRDDLQSMERYFLAKLIWIDSLLQPLQVDEDNKTVEDNSSTSSQTTAPVPVPLYAMDTHSSGKDDRDPAGAQRDISKFLQPPHTLTPSPLHHSDSIGVGQSLSRRVSIADRAACESSTRTPVPLINQGYRSANLRSIEAEDLCSTVRPYHSPPTENTPSPLDNRPESACTPKPATKSQGHQPAVRSEARTESPSDYGTRSRPSSAQIEYAKVTLFSPFPIKRQTPQPSNCGMPLPAPVETARTVFFSPCPPPQYKLGKPRRFDSSSDQVQHAWSNIPTAAPPVQPISMFSNNSNSNRETSSLTRGPQLALTAPVAVAAEAPPSHHLRAHASGSTHGTRPSDSIHCPLSARIPPANFGDTMTGIDDGLLVDTSWERVGTSASVFRASKEPLIQRHVADNKSLSPGRNEEAANHETSGVIRKANGCIDRQLATSATDTAENVIEHGIRPSLDHHLDALIDLSEPVRDVSATSSKASSLDMGMLIDFGENTNPTTPPKTNLRRPGGSSEPHELTPISQFACRASPERRAIAFEDQSRSEFPREQRTFPVCPYARAGDIGPSRHNPTRYNQITARHRDSSDRISSTFQYGVQYIPNDNTTTMDDTRVESGNLCQAVVISNLPADAKLRDVMPRVRGGNILRSTLVDTTIFKLGRSVFVVFDDCIGAQAYVEHAKKHPSHITVLCRQATVDFAGTPTYPSRGVNQLRGDESRCLEFRWAPPYFCDMILHHLESLFGNIEDAIEDMWYDTTESIFILFKNIDYAIRFHRFIRIRDEYMHKSHDLQYTRDPCSAPVSDLNSPIGLARECHDSLLESWLLKTRGIASAPRDAAQIDSRIHRLSTPARSDPAQPPSFGNPIPTTIMAQGDTEVVAAEIDDPTTRSHEAEHSEELPAGSPKLYRADSLKLPEAEGSVSYQTMTMAAFREKYGFNAYQKNAEKWRTAWPYVGDKAIPEPPEPVDEQFVRAQIPCEDGANQAMTDREDNALARLAKAE